MNTRSKGQRSVRKCIQRLSSVGWWCEPVERAGKFQKKDLFDLWDIIAIKPTRTKLIQVKTNRKPKLNIYKNFQKTFPQFDCEV